LTIENKEIRGITLKHVVWLVGGIVSGVVFVMATYFKIMQGISKIDNVQQSVNEIRVTQREERRELKSDVDRLKGDVQSVKDHQWRIDLILKDKGIMTPDGIGTPDNRDTSYLKRK
jgi:hypothetical protein